MKKFVEINHFLEHGKKNQNKLIINNFKFICHKIDSWGEKTNGQTDRCGYRSPPRELGLKKITMQCSYIFGKEKLATLVFYWSHCKSISR